MPTKVKSKKGSEALKKIIKIAKTLKKKSPNKQWKMLIKEASAIYRNKKK